MLYAITTPWSYKVLSQEFAAANPTARWQQRVLQLVREHLLSTKESGEGK